MIDHGALLPGMGVDEVARDLNETAFADADGGAGNANARVRGVPGRRSDVRCCRPSKCSTQHVGTQFINRIL